MEPSSTDALKPKETRIALKSTPSFIEIKIPPTPLLKSRVFIPCGGIATVLKLSSLWTIPALNLAIIPLIIQLFYITHLDLSEKKIRFDRGFVA